MTNAGRTRHWLRRSGGKLAVAASLLLHLLLGSWMAASASIVPPRVEHRPDEIWFDETPAPEARVEPEPEPVAPPKPEPLTDPRKKQKKTVDRQPTERQPKQVAEGTPSEAPPQDVPRSDSPRAPVALFPPDLPLSARGEIPVEPSRGETIHPDDPRFDPSVIAAKEKQRVKARVQGWAEDGLAEARAQNGLPHPYLMSLRDEGRKGLDKLARERGVRASGALAGKVLGQRYQSAVESYGKGGDPGLATDLAPGQASAPRLSERLTQPDQQALKALAQATEMFADLTHNKPLLSLTLELVQTRTNGLKTTVLKASIDPSFDAFVLDAWPLSIAKAGPPPPDAFRNAESEELRSIWQIEGWAAQTSLDKKMTYLPEAGVMGVPLTKIIPGASQGFGYEFRARLLRVY